MPPQVPLRPPGQGLPSPPYRRGVPGGPQGGQAEGGRDVGHRQGDRILLHIHRHRLPGKRDVYSKFVGEECFGTALKFSFDLYSHKL